MKNVDFDEKNELLTARTSDGLMLNIELGFQYRLKTDLDNIISIFYKWGDEGYHKHFIRISKACLRHTVSNYNAIQVFYNRTRNYR